MSELAKIECNIIKPEGIKDGEPCDIKLEVRWTLVSEEVRSAVVGFQNQNDTKFKVQADKQTDTIFLSGMTNGSLEGQEHHGAKPTDHDLFQIRITIDGEVKCTQWGSDGEDIIDGAIINSKMSLYFGRTWGNFTNFNRMADKPANEADLFLTQLQPDGSATTVQFGTNGHDAIHQVLFDPRGQLIIRGSTTGAFPNCRHNGSPEDNDCFLAMIEGQGHLVVVQFGSNGDDEAEAMMLDEQNNIFLLGRTRGTFPNNIRFATEEDDSDLFLTIVFRAQHRLMTMQWGSNGSDMIRGVAMNPKNGAILVAGHTSGAFPGNERQSKNEDDCDLFVSQITPDGLIKTHQWDTAGSRRIATLKLGENDVIQVLTEDKQVKEITQDDLKPQLPLENQAVEA